MKKLLLPLLLAVSFTFSSCGDAPAEESDTAVTDTEISIDEPEEPAEELEVAEVATPDEPAATSTEAADCDAFLTSYEEYATAYAVLATRFAKSPNDVAIMSEYTEMAAKAQAMQGTKPDACQADAAFLKRYTRVTAMITKAAAAQAAGSAKMLEQMSKQMGQ